MAWVGFAARLLTGGVWIVAGLLKLPDPAAGVRAVRAYEVPARGGRPDGRSRSAWARGLQIDCGCFGGFDAPAGEKYPWELARDFGLLFASLWLVRRPRSPWALDNRILHSSPARSPTGEPTS